MNMWSAGTQCRSHISWKLEMLLPIQHGNTDTQFKVIIQAFFLSFLPIMDNATSNQLTHWDRKEDRD